MATQKEVDELQAEIARLKGALEIEIKAKTEAEEMAMAVSAAGVFIGNTEEQPTGKTIKIQVCINPTERDERKLRYKDVDVPTYFYSIQLPSGAGMSLSTNGIDYYHGQTYEVDRDTLADLKSRVARCWDHEKSIHGDNENAYRKPVNTSLISKAAAARGAR